LTDQGKLRLDIVHCLEDEVDTDDTTSLSDVVLDGSNIVNMLKPGTAKAFQDYATDTFL